MKMKFLSTALILSLLFVLGPKFSLEAGHYHRHHRSQTSVHVGSSIHLAPSYPAYPRSYVAQSYSYAQPYPSYVEEHHYYPNGQAVTVYHNPPPVVVRPSPVESSLWFLGGLSMGFLLR